MAQDYDKIFKENIEELTLPLIGRLLHIYPERLESIALDVQATVERKPDFLKRVMHQNSDLDYILHIEFQTDDDIKMRYRMMEYYGLLLRKYELDIRQYVFFIGQGVAKMPTRIALSNLTFEFGLVNLQTADYHSFINSKAPEEVILAILADFGNDTAQTVVHAILQRIKDAPIPLLRKEKCLKQLEILSKLRNLQTEIINQLTTMALTYDIKTDLRYLQGAAEEKKAAEEREKELQQIIDEAQKEAIEAQKEAIEAQKEIERAQKEAMEAQKTNIKAIQTMLQKNMSAAEIADSIGVSLDFVQKIATELNRKKED